VETPEGDQIAQYRCLNFHAKRDGSPKLSLVIKNKWSSGWTKLWFYYRVPCRRSLEGSKSMYALHSWMSELDYAVKTEVECPDHDLNDAAFVRVTATIGGRDAVKEYVACKMNPLAIGFIFKSVPLGMTPMSKVETPLPLFVVGNIDVEHDDHVLAEIETEADKVLGSFRLKEYDGMCMANIPNDGHLSRVLEQMVVPYAPHPLPSTEASQVSIKKWKAEVSKKLVAERAKAGPSRVTPSKMASPSPKLGPAKKISIMKIVRPKAKPGP
jgi:hypothetical protein